MSNLDYAQGVYDERQRWQKKMTKMLMQIEQLEPTLNHGFEGFYSCQDKVLDVIHGYYSDNISIPNSKAYCPICGSPTSEGKKGGKICWNCVRERMRQNEQNYERTSETSDR